MPDLTIHVSDADLALLDRMGDELGLTAQKFTERLLHRTLNVAGKRKLVTHRKRSSDRALRQLEIMKLMRRRRIDTLGQADKQRLAKQFGVAERTIYRDLEIIEQSRRMDREAGGQSDDAKSSLQMMA